MNEQQCPSKDKFRAFISGQLELDQLETLSTHIKDCEVCQAKIDTISVLGGADQTFPPGEKSSNDQTIDLQKEKTRPEELDTSTSASDSIQPTVSTGEVSGYFGRYKILSTLGQGGMGAVYLAHDPKLDRKLAIKVPFIEPTEKDAILDRFLREARAVAQITHSNICPVYDAAEVDGKPYMAMAFIEGKPLSDFVRPGKPVAAAQTVKLIRVLALALHFAHEKGVIHRDLKPDNIMINKQKQPVIMDFGLARRQGINETQLTQAGQLMGTPAYMSPEQVSGKVEAMGPCCDIYSLGVIMYEMLTGQRPFTGDLLSVLSQIANNNPKALSSINTEVDEQLGAICLKAMEKQPENRYATMKDFADELTDYYQRRGSESNSMENAPAQTLSAIQATAKANEDSLNKTLELSNPTVPSPKIEVRPALRKSAQPSSSNGRSWKFWAVAAGMGGFALFLLLGIILLIPTKNGFIRIEVLDEQTDVVVTSTGATINSKTRKPIRIEDDGSSKLKITRDGFVFYTDAFEWKKGKDVAIKVDYKQGELKVVKDGKDLGVSPTQQDIESIAKTQDNHPPATKVTEVVAGAETSSFVDNTKGLNFPYAMQFDATGNLFVSNANTGQLMKVTPVGEVALIAKVFSATGLAFNKNGTLFVASQSQNTIGKYKPSGELIDDKWAKGFDSPRHIVFDSKGDLLVANINNGTISKVNPAGEVSTFISGINTPDGLAINPVGDLYVASNHTGNICKFDSTGKLVDEKFITGVNGVKGLLFDSSGNLYVTSFFGETVHKYDSSGKLVDDKFVAGLSGPNGMLFDKGGKHLYVANSNGNTITKAALKTAVVPIESMGSKGDSNSLAFDGQDDYVEIPTLKIPTGPFSIEAIVELESLPTGRKLSNIVSDTDGAFYLTANSKDGFTFLFSDDKQQYAGELAKTATLKNRVLVTTVFDGKNFALSANGKRFSSSFEKFAGTKGHIVLGLNPKIRSCFHGTLHELRISKVVRQVRKNDGKSLESDTDTLALYHFDEGQGEVLKDASGNNHHGKIVGAKWNVR